MIPAPLLESHRHYESCGDEIHDLRLRLLAAQDDVDLSKAELAYIEATIALTVEGRNAEERKAHLTIALEDSANYQAELTKLRAKQHVVGQLAADLEREQARERGYLWVMRYIAGLDARPVDA